MVLKYSAKPKYQFQNEACFLTVDDLIDGHYLHTTDYYPAWELPKCFLMICNGRCHNIYAVLLQKYVTWPTLEKTGQNLFAVVSSRKLELGSLNFIITGRKRVKNYWDYEKVKKIKTKNSVSRLIKSWIEKQTNNNAIKGFQDKRGNWNIFTIH